MTTITLPAFSLVVLIGPSGSGKSTFAARHFKPTEVLSADFFRGLLADDPNNQDVSGDAFEVLHTVAGKRLAGARLTVVDATHVQPDARKSPLELARRYHCLPVAVVFNLPEAVCQERNRLRQDRQIPGHVIHKQRQQLRRILPGLRAEGFHQVHVLSTPEEVDA